MYLQNAHVKNQGCKHKCIANNCRARRTQETKILTADQQGSSEVTETFKLSRWIQIVFIQGPLRRSGESQKMEFILTADNLAKSVVVGRQDKNTSVPSYRYEPHKWCIHMKLRVQTILQIEVLSLSVARLVTRCAINYKIKANNKEKVRKRNGQILQPVGKYAYR